MCSSDLEGSSRLPPLLTLLMTTPAINVTNLTLQSQPNRQTNKPCGGSASSSVQAGTAINLRRSESRPASINHPRDRTGWRAPGAWNHSKIVDNPNPLCSVKCWTTLPSGGCVGGSYVSFDNGYQWTLTGTALPAFPSGLTGRAVSRALLKLKHQSVNLAVAFAERKQTKDLFIHSARSIAKSVNKFKGAHSKDWGNVVKSGSWKKAPQRWLELQYGWKPLISDIQGACQEMSDHQNVTNSYLAKVSGVAGDESVVVWNKLMNYSTLYRFVVTDKWKHSARAVLYYRMRNPVLAKFASLGLTNPFELAWEKMKYSFVIDWFLPVGNWLSTLDADFGWDFHSGTLTTFSRGSSSSHFATTGLAPSHLKVDFSGSEYSAQGFSMNRSVYSSAPWGGIPRFKNPLSSQHVANAMSLLTQAFRR